MWGSKQSVARHSSCSFSHSTLHCCTHTHGRLTAHTAHAAAPPARPPWALGPQARGHTLVASLVTSIHLALCLAKAARATRGPHCRLVWGLRGQTRGDLNSAPHFLNARIQSPRAHQRLARHPPLLRLNGVEGSQRLHLSRPAALSRCEPQGPRILLDARPRRALWHDAAPAGDGPAQQSLSWRPAELRCSLTHDRLIEQTGAGAGAEGSAEGRVGCDVDSARCARGERRLLTAEAT